MRNDCFGISRLEFIHFCFFEGLCPKGGQLSFLHSPPSVLTSLACASASLDNVLPACSAYPPPVALQAVDPVLSMPTYLRSTAKFAAPLQAIVHALPDPFLVCEPLRLSLPLLDAGLKASPTVQAGLEVSHLAMRAGCPGARQDDTQLLHAPVFVFFILLFVEEAYLNLSCKLPFLLYPVHSRSTRIQHRM